MVKKLPQNTAFEEAVIGNLILKKEAYKSFESLLSDPDIFYHTGIKAIFEAIKALNDLNRNTDIDSICQLLTETGKLDHAGGKKKITEYAIARHFPGTSIEQKILKLHELNMKRRVFSISQELLSRSLNESEDAFALVGDGGRELFSILDKIPSNKITSISSPSAVELWMKEQESAARGKASGKSIGLQTGFVSLDSEFGGFRGGDLIIVAARPAMGKTALALCMASNQSRISARPVGFVSLEMSREQLQNRYMSLKSGVFASKIRDVDMTDTDWRRIHSAVSNINKENVLVEDTPAQTIDKIRANCSKMVKQFGCVAIYIDYLQYIHGGAAQKKNGNKEQEISLISRTLKEIARELKVPVIALSQLSRAVETRGGDKKPMLSDLRESGSIEQDADVVIFLYRPEYYGITAYGDGTPTAGICEINYAKYRNGKTGTKPLYFDGSLTMFSDIPVNQLQSTDYYLGNNG